MTLSIPKSAFIALIGIGLTAYYLWTNAFSMPTQEPTRPVSEKPYEDSIAGVGIIEPHEESIRVMPYTSGRVVNVFVKEGDTVQQGQALYQTDSATLQTQVATQRAELQALRASLARLQHEPRPETLPALNARVRASKAKYLREKSTYDRLSGVGDVRAISQNDLTLAKLKTDEALANWEEAKANLALQQAGAWTYDIQENNAKINAAQQKLATLQVQQNQSMVRSPVAGTVLQVNTRAGEYVMATQPGSSLGAREDAPMIISSNAPLQVRVDIDEVTATDLKPGGEAMAYIKGNAKLKFPLRYQRTEPYMIPKRSLTGNTAERVDVRVLQLIYEFDRPDDFPVYVGQQVEVFIQPAKEPNDNNAKPIAAANTQSQGDAS